MKLTPTQSYLPPVPRPSDPLAQSLIDMETVSTLLRMIFTAPPARTPHQTHDVVRKVIDHVQANFQDEVSLESIAHACATSKYHLCRVFRKATGMTLWDYLQELRLHHAIGLLQEGTHSISRVCHDSGFSDPSYFTKVFKAYAGKTPREWLKEYKVGGNTERVLDWNTANDE